MAWDGEVRRREPRIYSGLHIFKTKKAAHAAFFVSSINYTYFVKYLKYLPSVDIITFVVESNVFV